ncbi:Pycsar system effector family protein [Actinoplanes subglobosus]|uniref:Pycsar system effector family protein n=1 Tax=Actinoplanes subglobosus TaxID=1547892 RepID=A0ABV8IUS9_9ACTN
MPDTQHTPALASPDAGPAADAVDRIRITALLDSEIATVRALEPRSDTKAGTFTGLAMGLFVAGLTLLAPNKLPLAATIVGCLAEALVGAAVLLLTGALRPNVGGLFGFVRWAKTGSRQEIVAAVAAAPPVDSDASHAEKAGQLHWLSRSLLAKFERLRTAQTLIAAALAAAAIAAALTAMGR